MKPLIILLALTTARNALAGNPIVATIPPVDESVTDIATLLTNIGNFLVTIAFPLMAIAVIVSGIFFLISFGNEQRVARAKQMLQWSLIGVAVTLSAYAIVETIRTIV